MCSSDLVEEKNPPVAGLNLKMTVPEVAFGNKATTLLSAATRGFAISEKPDGHSTFTNPTALTEYTVCAREEAALAAIISPAARSALVFIAWCFLYLVCKVFVADKWLSVNGFFLGTLP